MGDNNYVQYTVEQRLDYYADKVRLITQQPRQDWERLKLNFYMWKYNSIVKKLREAAASAQVNQTP